MTDKVQKIREEVARIQLYTQSEVLKQVLDYIDKVQKEPASSIWHDASEKSNESENVVIINPSDNTGEVLTRCTDVYQGRIWAYTSVLLNLDNSCNFGKNLQEEPVPKVFEDMLNAKTAAESLGISPEKHDKIVDECLYGKETELVDEDDLPVIENKITISKEWFEHCKKSWYNEGYIDGKYNRDRQFEEPVSNSDWLTELQEKLDNATPEQLEELWNKYNGVDEEESVSEDLEKIVEEIAEPTILNAYGTKELARRLRNTICGTSVSEGLEEASKNYALNNTPWDDCKDEIQESFKAGAQWQKNQLPKWKKNPITGGCWSGEIAVNPITRLFRYEHYVINADKLFELLSKEK